MKRALLSGVFVAAVVGTVYADAAGDKVAASVIAAATRAKTLSFTYEVINVEPGKPEKKLELDVKHKGEKTYVELTAPADVKGTKILHLDAGQQYVYLPAFGKVRRIASADTSGFFGLACPLDHLVSTSWLARLGAYDVKVVADRADARDIVATPRAGQQPAYKKIEATIAKANDLPTQVKYHDANGALALTETRTGYTSEGGVSTAGEIKYVGARGVTTKFIRKRLKVNEAIADEVFSKRNLGE